MRPSVWSVGSAGHWPDLAPKDGDFGATRSAATARVEVLPRMLTIHDTRNDFAAKPCTTAVLPVGAIEQHGRHLPVGTDLMLAEALARPIAEKLDAYLLPPITIASSIEHRKAKGTVYLRADTLALVVRDIADALRGSGFARLVVVNFHGGNWILKPAVRQVNRDFAPFRAILLQPDLSPADARAILDHPVGDVHGGEYETSLMLHLYPREVRALPAEGGRSFPPQPLMDYFDSTELAPEGFWGWPEAATAEKGRRAFEALLAAAFRFIDEIEAMDRRLQEAARPAVTLRRLRADDIAFADQLRAGAGWNQTTNDWLGFVAFEPEGCFVAEVAGQRAGTATTIRYQDRFGWIGMVLVDPAQRRLGIGSRLLRQAIAWLQENGVGSVKLDATPMGRNVYLPLGFVDEYGLARYQGIAPAVEVPADGSVGRLADADWPAVLALDAAAFGADRAIVLRALQARHPELSFVCRRNGEVAGYLLARLGAGAAQVGPWVARDEAAAEELLYALFRRILGRRLLVDVIDPNPGAAALLRKHGFAVQRTLTRMYLGTNAHPGETGLVFGISSPEKG